MTQGTRTSQLIAIEWAGSLLGLFGAFLLATNSSISGFGFIAFLASNACWIACAIYPLQIGFMATSLLGITR